MHNQKPLAVVLHIAKTGYGVVRSLAPYNIPIIAFQKDLNRPEAKSKLCNSIITFETDDELLHKLTMLAQQNDSKPALYITSDIYVSFYVTFRPILESLFQIHFPSSEVVSLLLSKHNFQGFAEKNGYPVPKSLDCSNESELNQIIASLNFPIILKPHLRNDQWERNRLQKAYIIHTAEKLEKQVSVLWPIERNLIAQEFIPGPDGNVEYCLVYFDKNSQCIADFTGAKIRQYPVGTGSTSSTKPKQNSYLRNMTIKLFSQLQYKGFGSLEVKQHSITGEYFIMEPTVGRPDLQSYIATINGINIPLIAYECLTDYKFNHKKKPTGKVIYVLNWFDKLSTLELIRLGQFSRKDLMETFLKKKKYNLFTLDDPWVYFYSIWYFIKRAYKKFKGKNK